MPELFGDRIGDKHNKGEKEAIKRSMLVQHLHTSTCRFTLFLLTVGKGSICELQIGTCHQLLPSTSSRIKSCAATAAEFQHPLKEFRVESRNEAFCAPGKLAGQVFR